MGSLHGISLIFLNLLFMSNSAPEYTTLLVEYTQQVIAYNLIEFTQSNVTQSIDFSIRGMGSRKSEGYSKV